MRLNRNIKTIFPPKSLSWLGLGNAENRRVFPEETARAEQTAISRKGDCSYYSVLIMTEIISPLIIRNLVKKTILEC